jgi:hypothetical protein
MIYDKNHVFSDAQAAFDTDDTVESTNSINIGVADPNMGAGNKKTVRVVVSTLFESGTSVQAILQHSDDDSTWVTLLAGVVVLTAAAVVGKTLLEAVLPAEHMQYLQVAYVNVGANSAGACNAWLDISK